MAEKSAAHEAEAEFRAAFMRHDLDELESDPPAEVEVLIRRNEIDRLSPGTLAFLEYRSERDRELVLKMYGLLPGQTPRPLLGAQGPGTWNAKFYTEFHMTNDRDLWTDPKTSRLYNPRQILGPVPGTKNDPPYYDPAAWPDIRARMDKKGFWPLYEGKHIDQFLVDVKPVERWVNLHTAEKKKRKPPGAGQKLVFRDIARNTDAHTCIAAVLPEGSCANHKLPLIRCDLPGDWERRLLVVLNSFAFDFAARLRSGSTSLTFSQLSRCPVPTAAIRLDLVNLTTQSRAQHVAESRESWFPIWLANRAVAEAYGLTPDDFEYILSTFPVFARKRPAFYAYLLERVRGWKEETDAVARQEYLSQESGTSLPQAAEDMTTYGKRQRS